MIITPNTVQNNRAAEKPTGSKTALKYYVIKIIADLLKKHESRRA